MTDADRIRTALRTIRDDWEDALAPLPTPAGGGKNANKKGSRPPLGMEALSARTEIYEFLASWVRYTTGWYDRDGRLTDVPDMADWLTDHADDLAADEVIQDELSALEKLARELNLAANPPAPRQDAPGRCPEHPDHNLLRDPYVDGHFNCTADQTTGTVYDWWLRAHPDYQQTLTISDIAAHDGTDEAQTRDRLRNARLKPINPGRRPALYDLAALEWHREQQRQKRGATV